MLIRNKVDHTIALSRLRALMDAEEGTLEADQLGVLAMLIEAYEREKFPLPPPNPIEAIKFTMDQENLKKKDLVPYIGTLDRVNKVLSGKQPLTLKMVRALHHGLGIPAECLLAENA